MNIGNSVERGFDQFFAWLPNLVGALVILLVGWLVARLLSTLVHRVLKRAHLDEQMSRGRAGEMISRVVHEPSAALGTVTFWLVMIGTFSLTVTALGIDALTAFVASIYAYLPHVLAAALILVVAVMISTAVSAFVNRTMGGTPTGKVVQTAAPILIMTIATFMVLTELMIAEQIVLITYAGIVAAIALGSALAFGLGGRDAAKDALSTAVESGKRQQDQVRKDLGVGRTQTRRFVRGQEQDANSTQGDVEEPVHPISGPHLPPL
ncbi:MAG: hypothetical protein ABI200_02265 [Gaiellales bacterium]